MVVQIFGTITGRIWNAGRELKALEQSRAISRKACRSNVTTKTVPESKPVFLDIDYATIERQMVEKFAR